MRHRSFIFVAVFVVALMVGAVAVYAYDSSRDDLIAEGVSVSGVDVGGMRAADARAVVRARVARPLEQPVAVARGPERFTLSAREAGLRADVGGMVDEALRSSRDGTILSRAARDLTGGEERVDVRPRLSYSRKAVSRLITRVERRLNRPARDASLDFPSLARVKEQNGLAVKGGQLRRRVERALVTPGAERAMRAPTRVLQPKVTREDLADRYPYLLVVNRGGFQLKFYKRLRHVKTYTIAVGQVGFDTPAGLYHIQNKAVNPAWHVPNKAWAGSLAGQVIPGGRADNPIKARWMGIYDGAGIHGTDQTWSLGSRASHGCIRMAIPEVMELYEKIPVQTPVYIS